MAVLTQTQVTTLVQNAIEKLKLNSAGFVTSTTLKNVDLKKLTTHAVSIAMQESKFDTNAANKNSSAKGLFQILSGTKKDIETRVLKVPKNAIKDIFDAEYNTYLGVGYLAYQYLRYKNWTKAVIAYNLGSWKNQTVTDYSKKHFNYYTQLYGQNPDSNIGQSIVNQRRAFK